MEALRVLVQTYRLWVEHKCGPGRYAEQLINIIENKGIPELGDISEHDCNCTCEFHENVDELSCIKETLCIHEWDISAGPMFPPIPGLSSERIIEYMTKDNDYWENMSESGACELHVDAHWPKEEAEKILKYISDRRRLEEGYDDPNSPYNW